MTAIREILQSQCNGLKSAFQTALAVLPLGKKRALVRFFLFFSLCFGGFSLFLGILSAKPQSLNPQAQKSSQSSQSEQTKRKRNAFLSHKGFLRIAHQGASGRFPPNTLLAFRRALTAPYNAEVLEFDLRLTKDNAVVVFHDKNLKRITGLGRELSSLNLKDIQSLDAAYNFRPSRLIKAKALPFGRAYPYRGKGIRIPTLEEVFQTFPQSLMLIEIKAIEDTKKLSQETWKLIKKYKRLDKTMVSSFSYESIAYFRSLSQGQAVTGASKREALYYLFGCYLFNFSCEASFDVLQIPQLKNLASIFGQGLDLGSSKLIEFAHQNEIKVHYWTVNESTDMRKLIRNGADGIVTDFLDRLPR